MTAQKILDRVEELGILDPKIIAELRRQVRDSKFMITPEAIVKVLVDKGHLTAYQARKLVSDVTAQGDSEEASAAVGQPVAPANPVAKGPARSNIDDDDLIALGDSDSPIQLQPAASKADDDEEIVDLEAALPPATPKPIKATIKPLPPPATPSAKKPPENKKETKPAPKPVRPPVTDDEEVVELEAVKPAPPAPTKPAPPPPKPVTLEPPSPPPRPAAPQSPVVPVLKPIPSALQPVAPGLQPIAPTLTPLGPTPTLTPLGASPSSPPLPGLGSDPMFGGRGLEGFGPPKPPPEPEPPKIKKVEKGRWDSALMLLGGGGLGLLCLAFVGLYFGLSRGSSSEILEEASKAYDAGSYTQSADLYQKFAAGFPADPDVSLARVRVGMSRLWQSFENASDMRLALKEAQDGLPKIEGEDRFADARAELETILPTIADTFAEQAKSSTNMTRMKESVLSAHEAMKLVNNPSYIPTSRRKEHQSRIDGILEKIRIAERTINQDEALATAVTKVKEAVDAGNVAAAYQVRSELLQNYPALAQSEEVRKATLTIAEREGKLVRPAPLNQAAATDDPAGASHPRVVLVNRSGDAIPAPANATSFQLLQGAVFALDVAAGKVRWRRFVGHETTALPLVIAGGDVLVADQRLHELLRLEGATGKVLWRQTIGEPFLLAGIYEDSAFATTAAGRVARVNLASGEWNYASQLPQGVDVAAGIDARKKLLYQPARHSTIHVLAADDTQGEPLASRDIYYLGHRAGSLAIPPLVVLGHVFLFENAGIDYSLVHVLARNEENQLKPVREPIRLRGRMTLMPSVSGKRVVLLSDLGDVRIIDVEPANASSPINIIASEPPSYSQPTHGYSLLDGGRLWIADTRLAELEILTTRQELDRKNSSFDGDTFVAPLQIFDRSLVHVRKRQGADSLTITGKNLAGSGAWQIELPAGLAGIYSDMARREIAAITPDGNLYEIAQEHFKQGLRDQPSAGTGGGQAKAFRWAATLPSGAQLFLERRGRQWATYDANQTPRLQRVDANVTDAISAAPVSFAGGILAPLAGGSIWLLDPATGAALAETAPFQPELAAGAKIGWLPPVRVDDRQFIAIDRERRMLYLARREEKPKPFLAESRSLPLEYEPISAKVLGSTLYVVARADAADELLAYSLPSLEVAQKWPIEGRVGPRGIEASDETLFCETGAGELWQLAATPGITWKSRIVDGPLVSAPIKNGDAWLAATRNGQVLSLAADSGNVTLLQNAGEPLAGPLHLFGTRLIVGGPDGVLHILSVKQETP